MAEEIKTVGVPKWDGKKETAGTYLDKLKSTVMYYNAGDTMDETAMQNCPTKSEYDALLALTNPNPGEQTKIALWKANNRVMAIIMLGNDKAHAVAMAKATQTADFPMGKACDFVKKLEEIYRPSGTRAEILRDREVEKIQYDGAMDYYTRVTAVESQFESQMTETERVKHLLRMQENKSDVKTVSDHLDGTAVNFLQICLELQKTDDMLEGNTASTASEQGKKKKQEKEVALTNAEGTEKNSGGKTCSKCGSPSHLRRDCPKKKGNSSTGGGTSNGKGGNSNSNIKCNHCGKLGHKEAACWVKNPKKAPEWFKEKKEAANVEITLSAIDTPDKLKQLLGVDVPAGVDITDAFLLEEVEEEDFA